MRKAEAFNRCISPKHPFQFNCFLKIQIFSHIKIEQPNYFNNELINKLTLSKLITVNTTLNKEDSNLSKNGKEI